MKLSPKLNQVALDLNPMKPLSIPMMMEIFHECYINIYSGEMPAPNQKEIQAITICTFKDVTWAMRSAGQMATGLISTLCNETAKADWFCVFSKKDHQLFLIGDIGEYAFYDMRVHTRYLAAGTNFSIQVFISSDS